MKQIKLFFALFGLTMMISNAQIVTLDYESYTSSNCDVFSPLIPVQGVFHETKTGDVTKNTTQKALELKFDYNGSSTNQKGTEFAISGFTFKKNYKYTVKITAKNNSTYDEPAGLRCNFDPSGTDPNCNGVNFANGNNGTFSSSSDKWFKIVNGSTNFSELTFESDYLSTDRFNLGIGTFSRFNISLASQFKQTFYIKKIQIFEVPPPPTFTLTSNASGIACGATSSVVFTVNNVYNSPGTLTYNWSYPGWSGTVNTSMRAITLTPSSTTTLPGTVTVTPILNGVAQPTKSLTLPRSTFTSSATIAGSNAVCSSSSYTVNGLSSGQTVISWAVSSPALATLSATSGTSTVLTKTGNGQVTLSATIRNSCNQTVLKTLNINLGGSNPTAPAVPTVCVNLRDGNDYLLPATAGATSYQLISSSSNLKMNGTTNLTFTTAPRIINFKATVAGNYTVTFKTTNTCGTSTATFPVRAQLCSTSSRSADMFDVYPNPASSEIFIAYDRAMVSENVLMGTSNSVTENESITTELYDFGGNLVRAVNFGKSGNTPKVDISNLKKGIYFLRILAKETDEVHQIVKE